MVYMPLDTLTTGNWRCVGSSRYVVKVRKKLTGWKQGHTPAEFSEPLPLAGVLFWLFLLKDCLVAGEARIITTGATNDRLVDSNH